MTITKPYRRELIGAKVEITKATNNSLVGLKGIIIDETKHSFVIKCDDKNRRIIKRGVKFIVSIDGKDFTIDGNLVDVAPEERVKLK